MPDLADRGEPIVVAEPDSPDAQALAAVAKTVAQRVVGLSPALPITAR